MYQRKYLKKSILLYGQSNGEPFKRTFEILRRISDGASVVCYEARHAGSGRGVLKEFYPANALSLERSKSGQLVHAPGMGYDRERFRKALEEYLEPYRMLLRAKREDPSGDLQTFIPVFELYYGDEEEQDSARTAYIWTPVPESTTFESICREIHAHPTQRPEYKLVTVLNAIASLTKCMCAMHSLGLVHRDIKPGNFGFATRGGEPLTQAISLFDIDSVCPFYPLPRERIGTPGYGEPEIDEPDNDYFANCQTDIYSIGASLFQAVVVTGETEQGDYLYREEYAPRIGELVAQSRLITASEGNSHPKLRKYLTKVLEKCLCPRQNRYESCDDLLEDLKQALFYALPTQFAREITTGDRWVLEGAGEFLDRNAEKNSRLAMSYHLYSHPLYRCCPAQSEDLNVMILGFGRYGRQFLDLCLTIGQMRQKKLHVTVVSDEREDEEDYLAERPELVRFFRVGDHIHCTPEDYGSITFEVTTLSGSSRKENTDIIQSIIEQKQESKYQPHYIFIALGAPELTLNAALASQEAAEILEMPCCINFAWEEELLDAPLPEGVEAVFVCADVEKLPAYQEIERMAFNAHLVWEKDLNIDFGRVRAAFRKKYNHDSCVSNVLSIKYKLYSMGIDLDQVDLDTAARRFAAAREDKTARNELIAIEHRRWVAEKLCAGWQRLEDLEQCVGGGTKDEKEKRHLCIVKSEPNQRLAAEFRQNGSYSRWDTATEAELSRLDELDRLSVELHRMYARKAEELRGRNLLSDNSMTGIRELIDGDRNTMAAFQEWFTCLKEIWNRDYSKVRLYNGLKNAFLQAAQNLQPQLSKSLADQVKAFETMFYPLLASVEYRDFKQDDVAFVDSIPFILTYCDSAYLVIPFATGTHTEVFSNIAAAAVVNPARILYLAYLKDAQEVEGIRDALPYLVRFMKKKQLRAGLEFIIACNQNTAHLAGQSLEAELKSLADGMLRQVKFLRADNPEALTAQLREYLTSRQKGKRVFALEKNETNLSYLLQGAGAYGELPSYRFDSVTMKFQTEPGSEMLGWILKKPGISVADMTAFRQSRSESSNHPEFFSDYTALWNKYREKSSVWKQTCDVLGEHARNNDIIALFPKTLERDKTVNAVVRRYILPFGCYRTVERLVRFLVEHGVAEKESHVSGFTTDACQVILYDRCGNKGLYDRLFAKPYALMIPEAVDMHLNTRRHEVVVSFDDLVASNVRLPLNRSAEVQELMRFFAGKGYVTNLLFQGETMSFTYATRQIKELMTTAGKILEVYTYHKAKELGRFDDVVSGYEIDWESTGVRSELDCILTKGYCTLFVECKARQDIDQEFYYKLASLARQFGINAKAVLVADTQERSFYDNAPVNAMQRQRGSMLDVITVWKPQEIQNIGHTLLKIINGTYVPET